ncbi:unnamed protein product [Phyllotreta striolata]|uniref:GBD/FH3 domain-containing protein n=1 Tax=Phyllotreta striolata TaxID=444603 RepID=A0A9P0DJ93_PHYSR|nr:unnamed protein product [Phyllotreta striolata]
MKKRRQLLDSDENLLPKSTERYSKIDDPGREKQRPPIYNPEDYAYLLKKWGKKSGHGGALTLYASSSVSDLESNHSRASTFRDYRNPMLSAAGVEMTLRQFGTVSELLAKLKSDLRLAYPSFVQEFVADPLDGVTLLLDLLRAIQLNQTNNVQLQQSAQGTNAPKLPPAVQRRTLLDELSCLQCLQNCCARYSEAVRKLTACSARLFAVAVCIMSNVNKSRIVALELLSRACEPPASNHTAVSEAMSTLRLRFGEPVRFRFLVGMLSSAGSHVELLSAGLRFLNAFLKTSGSVQKRVYLQAELEQAGFDLTAIRKNIGVNLGVCEPLLDEMETFEKQFIDIESLRTRTEYAEKENGCLKDKLTELEQKIQVLQEEKGILISMDQCLREKCSELTEEVHSLKSAQSIEITSKNQESPPEDEGISSSERTPSPENDLQPASPVFELYAAPSPQILDDFDEEDETTIEEVIQELRDIISNEETEAYNRENAQPRRLRDDCEIVPVRLQPEPPRKSRSLVHLFARAGGDYEPDTKEIFFEAESLTSDSSFSVVDVSDCRQKKRSQSFKQPPRGEIDVWRRPVQKEDADEKGGSADGLLEERTKSDSGNLSVNSLCRSISNVYINKDTKTKLGTYSEEKHRMFLPSNGDENEMLYYFPRIQERKCSNSSSFLMSRGYNNAGLYSGQSIENHRYFSRSREVVGSDCRSSGKLTDYPSGLY